MRHSSPSTRASALALLALTACVRTVPLGPDVGACADTPDGVYTYGEIGIGTCLAGPADAQFLVRDGTTWLTVTNADPFRNFTSGSLLSIDMSGVARTQERYRVDELNAHALKMESFVGRFGLDGSQTKAVVASRLSDGSYLRTTDDKVWMVDLTDPAHATYQDRSFLSVGADPFAVVPDNAQGRSYVLNATGNSVSVLNTSVSPPVLLDPSPDSLVTGGELARVSGSQAIGELRTSRILDEEIARADQWTVTYVDGSTRLWAPTPSADGVGLARWTSGGVSWTESRLGVELDGGVAGLSGTSDPWILASGSGLLAYFAADGKIRSAFTDGAAGDWLVDSTPVVGGTAAWAEVQGGPSLIDVNGRATMYFDAHEEGATDSKIGVATTLDGTTWVAKSAPSIEPPPGFERVTQPSALVDPNNLAVRVWSSAWDGSHWVVALAQSTDDGLTFAPSEVVLDLGVESAAAPVVVVSGGRYRMWLTVSEGGGWSHATSWSWDGVNWSAPETVIDSEVPFDVAAPPRVGIQHAAEISWRVAGANVGTLGDSAFTGEPYSATGRGFALSVAAGQVTGTDVGYDLGGGIEPGGLADTDGVQTLYATGWSDLGVPRLIAMRLVAGRWMITRDDLMPAGSGGNAEGVRSPVVFRTGTTWTMLYAAGHDSLWTMRRATSPDGLDWTPAGKDLLPNPASWEAAEELPHSVTVDGDTLTAWYSGGDGNRWRMGQATSTDGGVTWARVGGRTELWTMDVGDPGTFDDSGVRDPFVVVDGEVTKVWYSGFDGAIWSIGYAERTGAGAFVRRTPPTALVPAASLSGAGRTFSALGVRSPVLLNDGVETTMWYSGTDGVAWRVGEAAAHDGELFPRQRFPLAGDSFTFDTHPGEPGRSQIKLGRQVGRLLLPGAPGGPTADGPSAGVLDASRGILWIVSHTFPGLIAVDVRDDSTSTFDDRNYLDIEAAVRVSTTTGLLGFQDVAVGPDGKLYLAATQPDSVLVIDPSNLVDDADDDVIDARVVGVLPMHDATDDQGETTFAFVGVSGLAFVPAQNLLIATHFRDNSLSIFDLSLGTAGEEIRYVPNVGENPSVVRVSPDGRSAVITNYLGEADGDVADSSLSLLDLSPASPTYLQITTRISNR